MDNFDTCCRLCLTQNEHLISVFGTENNNIPMQLSTCLSIEITAEDLLPKTICSKCCKTLHDYYMFYINSKCCEQWLLSCLPGLEAVQPFEKNENKSSNSRKDAESRVSPSEFLKLSDIELLNSDSNTFTGLEYLTQDEELSVISPITNNDNIKITKVQNYKGKLTDLNSDYYEIHMDIDVLDSDLDIVNEILAKQSTTITNSEKYSCLSCKSIFQDFEKLAHHMGGCDALKRTCTCCGILFESRESMMKHKNVLSELSVTTCEHCSKQFIGQEKLNQHIEQMHPDSVIDTGVMYRCKECGEIFQFKSKLYNHIKIHMKKKYKETSKKFSCNECGVSYGKEDELQNHKKIKHNAKSNSCLFRCKVCMKMFKDRQMLYKHIRQHTNVLEKTLHLCDSCGQSFNSYNTLSKHVLTHVGNQFQCIICYKPFINGSLLKKHLATHEIETQICEFCGLIFSNDILLNMHQTDIHSILF